MITAKQARDGSYDKVVLWCEKKLQPEIELSLFNKQKHASQLFMEEDVDPQKLKQTLERMEYKVVLTNMTEQSGFKSSLGVIYNVTIYWE